ncbi:methyltransferase domain-containing protein [candidate division WOR-3 bacterium]|uniref:Methyltransferase domain-containing protein n=1 Tax=candidate division WOR-3 bacterium TaxID=2052148 RepID=A0A9D5K977_UNCW3|nr:methyltransferase domain-containing protein [candidate division WOR-3 bacterium]MBD3363925.1 methyltransferase domain-containing protein [candidate division WOR-3 bacterium]
MRCDPTKAEVWDRFWTEKMDLDVYPPITNIASEIAEIVPDVKGLKVIEIGAGTGRTSIELAHRGAYVTILDISEQSLELARRFADKVDTATRKRISYVLADALDPGLEPESYDILFHQGLLEHFRSPYPLLAANNRLLKPGGLIVVDVPQTFHIYTILKQAQILMGNWFAGWERQFTPSSLSRTLKVNGFIPVKGYGDWPRPSLAYRALRIIGKKLGINLPMFPKVSVDSIWTRMDEFLRRKRLFHWTVMSYGLIARKA